MKKHKKLANDICALVYSATTNTGLIRDPETHVLRPVLEDSKPIRKLLKLLGRLRAAQREDHERRELLTTGHAKLAEDNRALQQEIDRMREVHCALQERIKDQRATIYALREELKEKSKTVAMLYYKIDRARVTLTSPGFGRTPRGMGERQNKAIKILNGNGGYSDTIGVTDDIPPAPEGPGPRDIKGSEAE